MNLVYIYGPPGVGKLTVATVLARLTGYRLFDNHTSMDWTKRLFDVGTDKFWPLQSRLIRVVLEEAIAAEVSVIGTFVAPVPVVTDFLTPFLRTVEERGGKAHFVRLTCEASVHEQRVQAQSRADHGKMTSVASLREMLKRPDSGLSMPGYKSLIIDNTDLSPAEAAGRVVEHFGLPLVPTYG